MANKFQIISFKKLYVLFFIIALSLPVVLFLVFEPFLNPFSIELIQKQFNNNWRIIYHDFDQDGYSECIKVYSEKKNAKYNLIVQAYQEDIDTEEIIDQFNFAEELQADRLFFNDFSGDGYDESIVFSQYDDSLFLSIINVRQKIFTLQRHPLLSVQKLNQFHKWDIKLFCKFLDVNGDGKKEIIFAIHSGMSLHPRGIYIFDLQQRKFINHFNTNAGINNFLLYDLTGDGKDEIIIIGKASGNIKTGDYNDYISWLFVLNQNLEAVFPPQSFSEFPGGLYGSPVKINGKSHLLLVSAYCGSKNTPLQLYLMNSDGLLIKDKYLDEGNLQKFLFDKEDSPSTIYLNFQNGKILSMDTDLNPILKKSLNLKLTNLRGIHDLNHDGEKELIISSATGMCILNTSLEILASYRNTEKIIGYFSFRHNGPNRNVDITFQSHGYFNLISYNKNLYYSFLPFIFIASTFVFFFIITMLFWLVRLVYIYIFYFLFSLKKSSHGLLILNHKGNIIYLNSNVQKYLNLTNQLTHREDYVSSLKDRPAVVSFISDSMSKAQSNIMEISITQPDYQFKGEIAVTPFKSGIGLVAAYLVEIKDYTTPILSDRLKSWTHSVQKMAHDIKQPLSSISLNLKALQHRLEPLQIESKTDINDDLQMMKSELDRVRLLTNNFLKFVNLDQPKMQYMDINILIKDSLKRYDVYLNNDFQITLDINEKLPSILLDPQQIEMVIHTLIENAIDALKGKGLIQINILVAQYLDKSFADYIQVEISDNGPGISTDIKDKIFEPFFTTKVVGTGMGLALAKKIIEDHKGFIDIYSDGKLGTAVRFAIPVVN